MDCRINVLLRKSLIIAALGTLPAQAGEATLRSVLVANGLDNPLWVTHAPGDYERIFVIEQLGRIRIIRNGLLQPVPFLDIDDLVSGPAEAGDERGLLGLAFHPDYAVNGFFYVNYTDNGSDTVAARYQATDPDEANVSSAMTVIRYDQPFPNHNGGWMAFGPDGYLYIASGDGGFMNDPGNRAQDITDQLLGKILRLDVNGDDFPADATRNYVIPPSNPFVGVTGDDEIWAYGLRNPWRCSFDSLTGELYIANVGQNVIEELNVQPAGVGGRNYGWRCMEGNNCTGFSGCTCNAPALTQPIHTYLHGGNPFRCSITGGEVYRGCAIPDLHGTYFFADFCSRQIWSLRTTGDGVIVQERTTELNPGAGLDIRTISSFGRDAYGELYLCDLNDGEVFKIVPEPLTPDCNRNGKIDACDLLDGTSLDTDDSGVPDECEVPIIITSSEPPNQAVDARQPSNLDGSNPTGWNSIDVTFSDDSFNLAAQDFTVIQQGGQLPPPIVVAVFALQDNVLRLVLNRAVEPRSWTTFRYDESGSEVRIGYLPGDVNADGLSGPLDILDLIDSINGIGEPQPIWSTDIDRSGLTQPNDILREIDLLNGAEAFDVFNGASLP